jgi:hypothetical protein
MLGFSVLPGLAFLRTNAVIPPVETAATATHAAVAKQSGHMETSD